MQVITRSARSKPWIDQLLWWHRGWKLYLQAGLLPSSCNLCLLPAALKACSGCVTSTTAPSTASTSWYVWATAVPRCSSPCFGLTCSGWHLKTIGVEHWWVDLVASLVLRCFHSYGGLNLSLNDLSLATYWRVAIGGAALQEIKSTVTLFCSFFPTCRFVSSRSGAPLALCSLQGAEKSLPCILLAEVSQGFIIQVYFCMWKSVAYGFLSHPYEAPCVLWQWPMA